MNVARSSRWLAATRAAALLAIDPMGLRGIIVRGGPGPVRDRWLELLQSLMNTEGVPKSSYRMPGNIDADALLGTLDLVASLASGRRCWSPGLLTRIGSSLLIVPMAERISAPIAAMVGQALRTRTLSIQRDGFERQESVLATLVACDETPHDEACPWNAMTEQLAMVVDLDGISMQAIAHDIPDVALIVEARDRLPTVTISDDDLRALSASALALGIRGMIAPILAGRVARASAALSGYSECGEDDLALASGLVYAQRARQMPAVPPADQASPPPENDAEADGADPPPTEEEASAPEPPEDVPPPDDESAETEMPSVDETTEIAVAAALAAIPAGLLAALAAASGRRAPATQLGRFGAESMSLIRGRPVGALRGRPANGARLHLLETIRAAIPHQRIRLAQAHARKRQRSSRVEIRPEDFRVRRFRQSAGTLSIFAVDASGSAALQRLSEAKGAIELLLADCYVRRDSVALIAFRGRQAQLLLPPTRSLTRARRELSQMPGGGGTPIAAGLLLASRLIDNALRDGQVPALIVLTDGRANITLDGRGVRDDALADSLRMARAIRARGISSLVIDTSVRAGQAARDIADAMSATCLALPFADARALNAAVRRHQSAA